MTAARLEPPDSEEAAATVKFVATGSEEVGSTEATARLAGVGGVGARAVV